MQIRIDEKSKEDIPLIKPLWEKLNLLHCKKSVNFKEKYRNWTFEERMRLLQEKIDNSLVKLDMLYDEEAEQYRGYCLSLIFEGKGTVESLYIDEGCRHHGLGGLLMQSALDWFNENGTNDITVGVAYDNKEALPFYQRYGFYVSTYILKKKAEDR